MTCIKFDGCNPLLEKVFASLDEVKANLHLLKEGMIFGEARERSIARIDHLISLVEGR